MKGMPCIVQPILFSAADKRCLITEVKLQKDQRVISRENEIELEILSMDPQK